jgi:MarR family transcriptional regulator for hemolysin
MKKEIGIYIDRTYKIVRQDLITRFKNAKINITPEQWVVLSMLENQTLSQASIANNSFKDKHTVSRIVDLLEKKKFISRAQDPTDGRKYLVSITEHGIAEITRAKEHVYASREQGWQNLSSSEYNQLKSLLDKIFYNYAK